MKIAIMAVALTFALSGTSALAQNGTAAGPTSLSGTGPSNIGGQDPAMVGNRAAHRTHHRHAMNANARALYYPGPHYPGPVGWYGALNGANHPTPSSSQGDVGPRGNNNGTLTGYYRGW
jgi:hypothetical protein